MTPWILPLEDVRLGFARRLSGPHYLTTIALSPDARRLYIGAESSTNTRGTNLAVLRLDQGQTGRPLRPAQRYPDRARVEGVLADVKSEVSALLPVFGRFNRPKLYLATQYGQAVQDSVLTVYDLTEDGDPLGPPRSFTPRPNLPDGVHPTAIPAHLQLWALALHPDRPVLYLGANGLSGLAYYQLDPVTGEPATATPGFAWVPQGGGKSSIGVDPARKLIYLGTATSQIAPGLVGNDLQTLRIDDNGVPPIKPALGVDYKQYTSDPSQPVTTYFRFLHTPGALYRLPPRPDFKTLNVSSPLAVLPLDPEGQPQPIQIYSGYGHKALAFAVVGSSLWLARDTHARDVFAPPDAPEQVSGFEPVALALPDGEVPEFPGQVFTAQGAEGREGVLLTVAANGQAVIVTQQAYKGVTSNTPIPLINVVQGYKVRMTVKAANVLASSTIQLFVDGKPSEKLKIGELSPCIALDTAKLKDQGGQVPFLLKFGAPNLRRLTVDIAIYQFDAGDCPQSGQITTLTETVQGDQVWLLLPGSAFQPGAARIGAIELVSEHAQRYQTAASKVALTPDERPRQFIISCQVLQGAQGHPEQLRRVAQAVGMLGSNTAHPSNWRYLPAADINATLNEAGLSRRGLAQYEPLDDMQGLGGPTPPEEFPKDGRTFFDFFYTHNTDVWKKYAEKWIEFMPALFTQNNGSPLSSGVLFALHDEPGWRYPQVAAVLRANPQWLAVFQDYLASIDLPPSFFGAAGWAEVQPLPDLPEPSADLEQRRLFYWTMRFLIESNGDGMRRLRQQLHEEFGTQLHVFLNCNNGSRWLAHHSTPTLCGPDWWEMSRRGAQTLWSADDHFDQDAQYWSFLAGMLRSAALAGGQPFGGYVRTYKCGEHPAGVSYKVLSLIGHGAKIVDLYSFGPQWVGGNAWSDVFAAYPAIAAVLRLVARAEQLLWPGQPAYGSVALLAEGSSSLWDPRDGRRCCYTVEIQYLHYALTHAGYTVDFVDDADIQGGALRTRGYRALYIAGPNVSQAARQAIMDWVQRGGTVAVLPGGAVADEYNTRSPNGGEPPAGQVQAPTFDEMLGLNGRERYDATYADNRIVIAQLQIVDELPLSDTPHELPPDVWLPVRGPRPRALLPTTAAIVARYVELEANGAALPDSEGVGITVNSFGRGQAIAYAFFPGLQYAMTADLDDLYALPRSWGSIERRLAALPAEVANARAAETAVADHELVEVRRLDSLQGTALVVLNWGDEPIDALTITMHNPLAPARRVRSAQGVAVRVTPTDQGIAVMLPIRNVDVVMIE